MSISTSIKRGATTLALGGVTALTAGVACHSFVSFMLSESHKMGNIAQRYEAQAITQEAAKRAELIKKLDEALVARRSVSLQQDAKGSFSLTVGSNGVYEKFTSPSVDEIKASKAAEAMAQNPTLKDTVTLTPTQVAEVSRVSNGLAGAAGTTLGLFVIVLWRSLTRERPHPLEALESNLPESYLR